MICETQFFFLSNHLLGDFTQQQHPLVEELRLECSFLRIHRTTSWNISSTFDLNLADVSKNGHPNSLASSSPSWVLT